MARRSYLGIIFLIPVLYILAVMDILDWWSALFYKFFQLVFNSVEIFIFIFVLLLVWSFYRIYKRH
ncbi:MAG: hypothetical protein ABIE23_05400 [archaeon]